jgi:hypothetical protein
VESCEDRQSKSCKLDALCIAIDVSCVSEAQSATDPCEDQSPTDLVAEAEREEQSPTDDLGEEQSATNPCKEQSPTDLVTEAEGYDVEETGSVIALLCHSVSNGNASLYAVDIDNVKNPFPEELPKI